MTTAKIAGCLAIGAVIVVVFLSFRSFDGWSAVRNYLRRGITHEKLTKVYYHGEWVFGEYRDCHSMNLREEDKEPELYCDAVLSTETGKIFNVKFSGDLTYDEEKSLGSVHFWLCRRDEADPSFSCGARRNPTSKSQIPTSKDQTEKPAGRQLTDSEIENLRERNECEQRFYDKKIYEVNGMSIGEACKQYPARLP
jgi:hypothetical protein